MGYNENNACYRVYTHPCIIYVFFRLHDIEKDFFVHVIVEAAVRVIRYTCSMTSWGRGRGGGLPLPLLLGFSTQPS